jgi:hypothetical protein
VPVPVPDRGFSGLPLLIDQLLGVSLLLKKHEAVPCQLVRRRFRQSSRAISYPLTDFLLLNIRFYFIL